jgi:hypothetical protein
MEDSGASRAGTARRRYGLVLLLAVAITGPVQAQQKEAFTITEMDGFVELGVRSRQESRSSGSSASGVDSDELKLEQLLHLNLSGYVYLPRFLKYNLAGDVHLLQETEQGNNDVLTGGKWSLSFFEEHPYSLELFRDDRQTQVEQPFFRSYEEDSSLYGATFRIRRGLMPADISYSHRESRRTGVGSDLDEIADDFAVRARHDVGEVSRTKLEYFRTVEENRGRDIFRQRFFLNNRSYLDEYKRRTFVGNLQYREQEDEGRDRLTTSAGGHLVWEHGPRLLTEYGAQFQRTDTDVQDSNDLDLEASLRHLLYQSLSSTIGGHARLQDASFGSTKRYGLNVTEEYTKRLADWGRLDINLFPYGELVRNRPSQTTAEVFDELRVMPDTAPVELGQRRIDSSTIVVTDSTGATIYAEGFDYLVFVQGDVTELTRLATGTIAADERVLVDDGYELTGSSDLLTSGVNLDVSVTIREWLVLYSQLRFSDEKLLSGDPDRELESRDRQVLGVSMSRGWLSTRTELERDDSNSRSFTGLSQWLSLSVPKQNWWHASFVTNSRFRSYDDAGESVMRLASIVRFGADMGRRGELRAAFDYQLEDWSGDGSAGFRDLEGFGALVELAYHFRVTEISLGGSLSRIDRQGQEENLDRLFFRARRSF